MKFQVIAIGKMKKGAQTALMDEYLKRLKGWQVDIREIPEAKTSNSEQRKLLDAKNIISHLDNDAFIIALDERGLNMDSIQFAQILAQSANQSFGKIIMIIGGSDGLHEDVRSRCHKLISFGKLTWPHQLVRVMLCEQIYRAKTILENHPYHKV